MNDQPHNYDNILTSLRFHYHRLRRETSNFSLYKSRHVAAQLVSQHQSGTHWLKYMLANALAHQHELPGPQFNHANDFIGGPKDQIVYPQLPRLVSSHSIPPLVTPLLLKLKMLQFPKYIVLVRDIRASLVSNYRKWRDRYGVEFSEFLRGDPAGKKYNSDIWWSIRFLNAWGRFQCFSDSTLLVVRYEDLRVNTQAEIERINQFIALSLREEDIAHAISTASKQAMLSKADPERPPGEVNKQEVEIESYFNSHDKHYFEEMCRAFLKYDFGYDYSQWH